MLSGHHNTKGEVFRAISEGKLVVGDFIYLYDDQGKPPVQAVRTESLGKACYMSNRTGWADADLLWSFPPDGGDDGNRTRVISLED